MEDTKKVQMSAADKAAIDRLFEAENEKQFEMATKVIKRVYIDLDVLQDFRLGALIAMIDSQEKYDYIIKNTLVYEATYRNDITTAFPALGISDEQVDAYVADKHNWANLAVVSPFRTAAVEISEALSTIYAINQVKKYFDKIIVDIGMPTVVYTPPAREKLLMLILHDINNIILSFSPSSLYENAKVPIDDYDIYFLKEASKLINHPSLVNGFRDRKYSGKFIIALPELTTSDEELHASGTEPAEALNATAEFASLFVNFSYMQKTILR